MQGVIDYPAHHFPNVYAQDNATVHLGDVHYHGIVLDKSGEFLTSNQPQTGRKHAIWKEGFNHGFVLERVPLINRFVGRHEHIEEMKQCLLSTSPQTRRKVYVASGLGGMGKTQLSVEFARCYQHAFSSTFFIDASSKDALLQSFLMIFRRISTNEAQEREKSSNDEKEESVTAEGVAAKVLDWFSLEGNTKWLLIYDNVDLEPTDPGGFALNDYLPTRDCGSIIVTTRLASLPVAGIHRRLTELSSQDSLELLSEVTTVEQQLKNTTVSKFKLNKLATARQKLVENLGGLPLAITQAGSLMRSIGVEADEYLNLYQRSKRKVMDMLVPEGDRAHRDRGNLRTTWATSVNLLKHRIVSNDHDDVNYQAYRLLHLFAYFEPADLDYDLLRNGKLINDAPGWLLRVFDTKLDFFSAIKVLLDLSLIDKTSSSGIYSMHRVVHDWLCTYEAQRTEPELLNIAVAAIAWTCPVQYSPLHWQESQQKLIRHAKVLHPRLRGNYSYSRPVVYEHASDLDLDLAAELWECDVETIQQAGVYQPIGDIARLISGDGNAREGLNIIEQYQSQVYPNPRANDISYFALLYDKAALQQDMGRAQQCSATLAEALDGFKRLGNAYWHVCCLVMQAHEASDTRYGFDLAAEYGRSALSIARAAGLCTFHPPMWLAFQNLASLLRWRENGSDERLALFESVREEAEGIAVENSSARTTLRTLARIYDQYDRHDAAEQLFLQLLEWEKDIHGPDSEDLRWPLRDLHLLYYGLQRREVIQCDQEWIRICELNFGPASSRAIAAHYELAQSYLRLQELELAQASFEQCQRLQDVQRQEHALPLIESSGLGWSM